jgi:tetraacyldisaccharide 4'-kinase
VSKSSFYNTLLALHYPLAGKRLSVFAAFLSILLWPCSKLYGLGILLHSKAYELGWLKSFQPDAPVISIGNLTTGGTGKTPVTLALVQALMRAGLKVAVLSRGYGALKPQAQPCLATHPHLGDEPYWLQQRLHEEASAGKAWVVVCKNRVKAAQWACRQFQPDVLVLDDGFQHRRLKRQVDLVLIDGQRLLGSGKLLPLGALREPVSALRRASFIALTKLEPNTPQAEQAIAQVQLWLKHYGRDGLAPPPVFVLPFVYGALQPIFTDEIRGNATPQARENALLVSALANPTGFEQAVKEQTALNVLQHLTYPDHCTYQSGETETLLALWQEQDRPWLVTSEKDAVKLKEVLPEVLRPYLWALPFKASLPEAFIEGVLAAIQL